MAYETQKGLGSLAQQQMVSRYEYDADRIRKKKVEDPEYLMDWQILERQDGKVVPLHEGVGGMFRTLGYYGDPRNPYENQVNIAHYNRPLTHAQERYKYPPFPTEEGRKQQAEYDAGRIHGFYNIGGRQAPEILFEPQVAETFTSGEFPQRGSIAIDATLQTAKPSEGDYRSTVRHELKHRGMDSSAMKRLEKSLRANTDDASKKLLAQIRHLRREEEVHEGFEIIRKLQQGEITYEDLSKSEHSDAKALLKKFMDVEQALLNSLTKEEQLKLGMFERQTDSSIPPEWRYSYPKEIEMPEDYREGGRVRLI